MIAYAAFFLILGLICFQLKSGVLGFLGIIFLGIGIFCGVAVFVLFLHKTLGQEMRL